MVKQTIQIFARIKPYAKGKRGVYDIDIDSEEKPRLTISVPRDLADGFINNKKEHYKFRYNQLFDQNSKQDEIFDSVAKPVVDSVMEGYNGTIFAYGQTGSGKTFTITGGAEHYIDRGIIPRTLSYCFEHFEKDYERSYTLHVSYLEIYNESGYDLLDPQHEYAKLEDLPKVTLMEDTDQNIHLKNLSVHQAANEEEALNLLFLGDTNRMIAETPMNQASTRSHCIFTIHITSKEIGSATIRRAKLHLVDLAGSERVSKSGVNGMLLVEAKYINLSLHYLEQVIIALSEKSRQHIPYRNSMMTSVLRDSLGGNCMTTMIATCSMDRRNIDESISTCRFAQRVAMIKNDVMVNEELDPRLMIQKLKREIQQLKEELALATGEQRGDELTADEKDVCEQAVRTYIEDNDPESVLSVGADLRKIQCCFSSMKKMILEKKDVQEKTPLGEPLESVDTSPYNKAENAELKERIQQRDNEINILVGMLKKEKKKTADILAQVNNGTISTADSDNLSINSSVSQSRTSSRGDEISKPSRTKQQRSISGTPEKHERSAMGSKKGYDEKAKQKILGDMSVGRQEAFEVFRQNYAYNEAIEENKFQLKSRYAEAKKLGEQVNHTRVNIGGLKSQIEQHRMQMAMQGLIDPDNPEPDEVEIQLREGIDEEKANYKYAFTRLKELKTEIEHLQHLLERSKVKLLKDFELWWANQWARAQEENSRGKASQDQVKSAWPTPPVTPGINKSEGHGMTYPQRDPSLSSMSETSTLSDIGMSHGRRPNSSRFQKPVSPDKNGRPDSINSGLGTIQLTGDPKADADIMAFMKARQKLLQKTK